MRLFKNRFFPASPLQIFAVGTDSIQLVWGSLPAATIMVTTRSQSSDFGDSGVHRLELHFEGGAGSALITGLKPETPYAVEISTGGSAGQPLQTLQATTLPTPGGPRLCKIATVSDLHIGSTRFGALKTMTDIEPGGEPFAFRCARSAITDAVDWGADVIVIKGDATHVQSTDDMSELGRLVDKFPDTPMMLLPGNHDVDGRGDLDLLPESVGKRELRFVRQVDQLPMPGVTIIGGNTTIPQKGVGTIATIGDELIAAASHAQPALVLIHHQCNERRLHHYWPPGIPSAEAKPFLKKLGAAAPRTVVSSGHTHRNRARSDGPILLTEVASTRDWPGVWAGYEIYEDGLTQTVRKASAPNALRWHEYGRQALGGLWSGWSPGPLEQRSFTHRWTAAKPYRR